MSPQPTLLTIGRGDPHLVLRREAARGADLFLGEHAGLGEASNFGVYVRTGFHLDSQMVDRAAMTRVLQQHQLQWRGIDRKVRVTRFAFGRLHTKELGYVKAFGMLEPCPRRFPW